MSKVETTLNDGSRIPWLGFGTGTALYKQDAAQLVRQAISTGATHLDGAQAYENEDTLGEGIKLSKKPRSELFVTTKLKAPKPGQSVKDTLLESLKKLDMKYVDLFLIHDPTSYHKEGKLKEVWAQMEEVKGEGLARSVGVSNFTVEHLQEVLPGAKIIPSINQVGVHQATASAEPDREIQIELHPYVWTATEPILELCKKHGIKIASYGGSTPLARVPDGPLKDVLPAIRARLEQTRGSPVTEGQVLSKWILQKGAIVITTSSKVSRVKGFLDTENVPELTEQEIWSIDEAGSKLHKRIFMRHCFNE
ncbi:NAD/NADP-dependent indole-3-acetaldehyde reductase [Leucoagaricus sp. SymC.cos]|nr:NAD/NADP-dependent indole-3-acetaldehyde reductase [Leucoagaricus sp. SymC.cos]